MRIENVKLDFKDKAHAKVGSLGNTTHTPGGGNIMVIKKKVVMQSLSLFSFLTESSSPADREPQADVPRNGQSSSGPRRGNRGHPLPRAGDRRNLSSPVFCRQHQPPGVAAALHAGPGCYRRPGQAGIMSVL